ncbi:MAG: carboxylating nicotinate-nucleotide diphosphorylase [Cyanobacteria bacterium P01_A01_bin.84]
MERCIATLPALLLLDEDIKEWLKEDIGRGDRTTSSLLLPERSLGSAKWVAKASGIVAGLPLAARVFQLLDNQVEFISLLKEGEPCQPGEVLAEIKGSLNALLTGERVALNLAMRLSGIATLTQKYVEQISDLPTQFVDTRKTTPGLRLLEKYATKVGGATNHRMGLDDAVMIKDNHIAVAGGIGKAISQIRSQVPYPTKIEVETENLEQVKEALVNRTDIIMLDNMSLELMHEAVKIIRQQDSQVKVEASGNINLDNIRLVAEAEIDYISSSAPITQSKWLDLSMRMY